MIGDELADILDAISKGKTVAAGQLERIRMTLNSLGAAAGAIASRMSQSGKDIKDVRYSERQFVGAKIMQADVSSSIATGVWSMVGFDSVAYQYQQGSPFWSSAESSVVHIRESGIYNVFGSVRFSLAGTSGFRTVSVGSYLSSGAGDAPIARGNLLSYFISGDATPHGGGGTEVTFAGSHALNAGEQLGMAVWQNSGYSSMTLDNIRLTIQKVAEQ